MTHLHFSWLWFVYARYAYALLAIGFCGGMKIADMKDARDPQYKFWRNSVLEFAAAIWLLDVAFNVVCGSIIYREAPRLLRGEFTFSARTARIINAPGFYSNRQWEAADRWARRLNAVRKGHIKIRWKGETA